MVAPLVIAAVTPLVKSLLENGLSLLGNAIQAKGKEYVEKKLGVELPPEDKPVPAEKLVEYRELEFKHEETLQQLAVRRAELELEGEKVEQGNVTDRWRIDMASDSWLSKNVRPLIVIYLTVVISIMAFASQWLKVSDQWIQLLGTAFTTAIVALFGSRGIEKVTSMRSKK